MLSLLNSELPSVIVLINMSPSQLSPHLCIFREICNDPTKAWGAVVNAPSHTLLLFNPAKIGKFIHPCI